MYITVEEATKAILCLASWLQNLCDKISMRNANYLTFVYVVMPLEKVLYRDVQPARDSFLAYLVVLRTFVTAFDEISFFQNETCWGKEDFVEVS